MVIFSSMTGAMIDLSKTGSKGVAGLKAFLEFDGIDAHDVPVIALQGLNLQNVPVFDGKGVRPVAHDGENKFMLISGIGNRDVDFEVRHAHVIAAVVAVRGKLLRDILSDSRFFGDEISRGNRQRRSTLSHLHCGS